MIEWMNTSEFKCLLIHSDWFDSIELKPSESAAKKRMENNQQLR